MRIFLGATITLIVIGYLFTSTNVFISSSEIQGENSSQVNTENHTAVSPAIIDKNSVQTYRASNVDGSLRVDEQGNLITDIQLKHWMDYHLSALGELPLDQILAMMRAEMNLLAEPAKSQAHQMLDNYIAYKDQLAEFDQSGQEIEIADQLNFGDMKSRLDWQKRLRREVFSPEVVSNFWGLDEIIDDYTVAKMDIEKSDLSTEQKQAELELLEQNLPEEVRQRRADTSLSVDVQAQEQALIDNGASDSEIYQLRAEKFGDEAAQRLAELDQQQNDWKQRVQAYNQEKQRIDSIEGISTEEKNSLLGEYASQNFSELEQKRLSAASALYQ